MFVHKKANCISQLNNDYIKAIHLTLSFKNLIFEINFFWDSNINRIFLMNKDYTSNVFFQLNSSKKKVHIFLLIGYFLSIGLPVLTSHTVCSVVHFIIFISSSSGISSFISSLPSSESLVPPFKTLKLCIHISFTFSSDFRHVCINIW